MIGAVLHASPLRIPNPAFNALGIGEEGQKLQEELTQREVARQKMALAQQMAPTQENLQRAQANLTALRAQNPATLLSGSAQQLAQADFLDQQGKHQEADAIRNALNVRQQFQQSTGNWREQQARLAALHTIPAASRGPVVSALMNQGYFAQDFPDLSADQRQDISNVMSAAARFHQLPALLKTGSVMSQAAEKNLGDLETIYNQLRDEGLKSGIQGWTQMRLNELSSRVGQNSPIQNLINQAKQTQYTLAKQYQRIEGFPNTDEGFRHAAAIIGSPEEIGKMTWPQVMNKLANAHHLIWVAEKALQHPLGENLKGSSPMSSLQSRKENVTPGWVKSKKDYQQWFSSLTRSQKQQLREGI